MNSINFKNTPPISILILIALGSVYFYFCLNAVCVGDDIRYQFQYTEENGTLIKDYDEFNDRIESVGDIVSSLTVHHNWVNGRDVAHFLVHLFCGILGQKAFAVFDGIMIIVFVLLILKICRSSIKNIWSLLSIVVLVILCLGTRMTPAYQINYIWMFSLLLAFLCVYFRRSNTRNFFLLVLLGLFSFVSGSAHEGLGIGIGAAIIIDWVRNRKSFTPVQYVMSISFGLGLIWLCLAPGNFVRVDNTAVSSMVGSLLCFISTVKAFYLFIAIVIIKVVRGGWKRILEIYSSNAFYINSMFVLILFNLSLGLVGLRPLLGIELLAIIISIRMLENHALPKTLIALLYIVSAVFLIGQVKKCNKIKTEWDEVLAQYGKGKQTSIYISEIIPEKESPLCDYARSPVRLCVSEGEAGEAHSMLINKYLHWKFKRKSEDIKIVPMYLRGKDSVDMGNQVVRYGEGVYLLIQSKKDPKDFMIKRSIDILGIVKRDYGSMKYEFSHVIKETDYWRAELLYEDAITIFHLSDNEVWVKER